MSELGKLSWRDCKSALIYVGLTAVVSVAGYILGVGDVFAIDMKSLANVLALSVAAGLVSILKQLLTTKKGEFLGQVDLNK
jgi:hypothetical protein